MAHSPAESNAFFLVPRPETDQEIDLYYRSRFSWLPLVPGWPTTNGRPTRNRFTTDLELAYANTRVPFSLHHILGQIPYTNPARVMRLLITYLEQRQLQQEIDDSEMMMAHPDWLTNLGRHAAEGRIRALASLHNIQFSAFHFRGIADLSTVIDDVLPPGQSPSPSPPPSPGNRGSYTPERQDWSD